MSGGNTEIPGAEIYGFKKTSGIWTKAGEHGVIMALTASWSALKLNVSLCDYQYIEYL
jgi:hypothetical protein